MSLASLPITFFCGSFNTHHDFSIKHSKEYFYQPRVIATIDNNKAFLLWAVCVENRSYSTEIFLLEFESEFESDTTVPIVPQRWRIRYITYELSPYGTSGTFQ